MGYRESAVTDLQESSEIVEILLPDVNGVLRGKQMPAADLGKLITKDGKPGTVVLPRGTLFLDTHGRVADTVAYGMPDGDPDRVLLPIDGTLLPVPWKKRPTAQILTEVSDDSKRPWSLNPRRLLEGVQNRLLDTGMRPVVAVELEFYLLDVSRARPEPYVGEDSLPTFAGPQTYNLDVLSDYTEFLSAVELACHAQGIPATSITSEYGQGQFEINLKHTSDCLAACDHAVLLRRVVRQVAASIGAHATFMAKPLDGESGSGMHLHISLEGEDATSGDRVNVFASDGPSLSPLHSQGLAGALEVLPASIALMAQNANAYKRFVPDSFAPVVADWGLDHRGVALRVPYDRGNNTRLEHRVAGADSNPYLNLAAILAGIHHGIENKLSLPEATEGETVSKDAQPIPTRWREALTMFDASDIMKRYFGEEFCAIYSALKHHEEALSHAAVTGADHDSYLRTH